jgi:hypothetical protein
MLKNILIQVNLLKPKFRSLYSVEGTGAGAGLVELIESMTLIMYGELIRSTNHD